MTNYRFWPEISTCLNEIKKEKNRLTKSSINLDTLTSVRDKIKSHVEQLKTSFQQELEQHSSYLAIFAIIAYVDENVQRHISEIGQGNWAPLQVDFYGADSSGELFYSCIDEILENPETPSIVPQIYYFILKKGFQGKYQDSKTQINKYIENLKGIIPVAAPSSNMHSETSILNKTKRRFKPWHYYASALAVATCLLITLYISSSFGY